MQLGTVVPDLFAGDGGFRFGFHRAGFRASVSGVDA
jgi:site-specific DNA-cytosine methylase